MNKLLLNQKSPATFKILAILAVFLFPALGQAQCPVAASCTPGTAPSTAVMFGMGIYHVEVGTGAAGFTNSSGGGIDGYMDFSCTKKTIVAEGAAIPISVSTNANVNETVRVWIDLNNNGAFATSELIFSSNNAKVHSGTITIPVSATVVKNTVLRMRIAADNFASPVPTPCSIPAYSQTEDYGITVVANTNKPAVDFSADNPVTCSPSVQFQNLTQNGATSYLWDFGDNTTSTLQNPSHTYSATGTYTVKLKACNANGCDSLSKVNYINYHNVAPAAATCSPATTGYCCGYGITKVSFHTLVNATQNGSVGYEDFTCTKLVTVEEGKQYTISLETSPSNSQDSWVYIDYNNNGAFEPTELVFTALNTFNPSGNISIKGGAVLNLPLRMRVISDIQGSATGPCTNRASGQAEDYTVIITPGTSKPTAGFISDYSNLCDSTVQFTNTSLSAPTSFWWDFGDNSTPSTLEHPQHTYSRSGSYTVTLRACNAFGCDTLVKQNYIAYNKACPTYCIPANNTNYGLYISYIMLKNIFHQTGKEQNAYGNYTHISTDLVKGTTYPISIGVMYNGPRVIKVLIDYNQDGDFDDPTEEAFPSYMNTTIHFTFKVPVSAKSGLTRMRVMASRNGFINCQNNQWELEAEDYSVNILPNNQKPTAQFSIYNPSQTNCSYTVAFSDRSVNSATSWYWDFGDPASGAANYSTLQDPRHTFSAPGAYAIKLTACNPFGCDSLTKTSFITVTSNNGPQTAKCLPYFTPVYSRPTIKHFSFNSINHSPHTMNRLQDHTCTIGTVVRPGNTYSISIQDSSVNNMDVRVWIDLNNDATLDPIAELMFSSDNAKLHLGTISIPANAVQNQSLRMRIANESSHLNSPPLPCGELKEGQAIDYAVTISNVLGTGEIQKIDNLIAYPNPNTGKFNLQIPNNFKGNYQLEITNLLGQVLLQKTTDLSEKTETQLDLTGYSKGVYFVRISNGRFSGVKKVVVE